MKQCGRCQRSRKRDAFHKDRNRSDGLYPYCKDCVGVPKTACESCCTLKPRTGFHPERSTCKACDAADGLAWCSKCKTVKPTADFYADKNRNSGTYSVCKPCCREYDAKGLNRWRTSTKYGISPEQYAAMVMKQNGLCAVCNKPEKQKRLGRKIRLHIDHDHATGEVRGLLCTNCNLGVGRFLDDPTLLRAAATYLESVRAESKKMGVETRGNR